MRRRSILWEWSAAIYPWVRLRYASPHGEEYLDDIDSPDDVACQILRGAPMGWSAIGLIFLFVVAFAVLNRIEFGCFD